MSTSQSSPFPYLVMLASPLFFSTNLVFGRYVTGDIAPFLLATIRWASVALILSPILVIHRAAISELVRLQWKRLALLGVLGMGICGGGVYLGLKYTTATNGTLIYTTSPVLILLFEGLFAGRRSHQREVIGMAIAFCGVAVIVLRGSLQTALSLSFNLGDILIFFAAASWAAYSILYRSESLRQTGNLPLFGLVAIFGALANLPFALWELSTGTALQTQPESWLAVVGIVLISSLLAFSTYQFGIRALGASLAGVFMYLLPPYGVMLAILFLGEEFHAFHTAGIALVMAGVILATFPASLLNRRKKGG